ncbi:hypothetical protein like AT3G24255 [Hibiscus trionum]|uniref:Reverse transcriptase domain-containing protein n=1 Tax=Hibiscus trionum TaxID=183268 RepID=A0A9W7M8C2_HIBTR|nr:hypothetical protein like AT3G24255 [Hibiscus trionum]
MERLGHLINHSVAQGDWSPFFFRRNGTCLSHLFFADDLILYARADVSQALIINNILSAFGNYSGHRVSKNKTQICFSAAVSDSIKAAISDVFGFRVVDSLGKYLGVPVIHQRLRCSDFDFILDKIKARLNGWAARTLSIAGRITLAKSVISAIPVYFMQTMILPKKVCNDIEGLIRRFIWGSASPTQKISLINWEAVCQPMQSGGLGLRRMHNFNMAFILKLSYSIVTRTSSLWVTLLREKYGMQETLP